MKRWLVAVVLLASAMAKDFTGMPRLARFSRTANATVLVYFNNENIFAVLNHGNAVPLHIDTQLWRPEFCCAHRATPSLSRDGRRIAFVSLKGTNPRREAVNILDLETWKRKEICEDVFVWGISWSPAGDRIAVIADDEGTKRHGVRVLDAETGQTVTNIDNAAFAGERYLISDYVPPSWSQDGTRLAIEVRRPGPGANNSTSSAIVIWELASGKLLKLSDGTDPSWSPQGDEIAYFDASRRNCYVIAPNGTHKNLLFSSTKGVLGFGGHAPLFFPVVWAPDGHALVFHEWVDADLITEVYEFNLKARKTRHVGRSELQVVNWR